MVGDKVDAKYMGGSKWFRGEVKAFNADGSYSIKYDDGETEDAVSSSFLRLAEAAPVGLSQTRKQAHLAPLVLSSCAR